MGEDEEDKLLVAAQKWSLESSSAPLEQSSSNCNISQDVSPHHIMSKDIPTLSTSAGTITPTPVNLDDDSDSNFPSNSHAEQSSVPSYINNPLVWAPLSTNDFIGDPSVIAAALSGTSDIADRVVQYEEVTVPSVPRSISPPRSSRDTVVDTAQQYHTAMQMQIPKTRLDELGISKPPTSSRDRDTVPTKTISDELKEEGVPSNKQLVATSKEFVPLKKNETSSSKLSPTSSSFDYSSVPMPPPLPQHQHQQISHQITDVSPLPRQQKAATLDIKLPPIEGGRGNPNGLYQQISTLHDETNMYIKEGVWDGQSVTFVVYRDSHVDPSTRWCKLKKYWLVGIVDGIILFNSRHSTNLREPPLRIGWSAKDWDTFDKNLPYYKKIGQSYPLTTPQIVTDKINLYKEQRQQHQYQQISHQITDPPIEGDRIHWTVKVSRCGIPDVNGLYNESRNRNGYTSYIKHKIKWQRRTGKCVLHRDEFYWYIGFQSSFVKEGRVETFYQAQVYQYSSFAPPHGSWVTKGPFGVDPPPKVLEIGWFDCQTRKYTRYLRDRREMRTIASPSSWKPLSFKQVSTARDIFSSI